jgi:spermidine/putrescine ABC transporter ATP-binding subunit
MEPKPAFTLQGEIKTLKMKQKNEAASVGIHNLFKRFDSVVAVNNISLDIKPGEFITLLGPSGSGKTTTLMMIAGFEIPDRGEILVDDVPIMFTPAYKRGMGMVFQNYSLFPHMTVERNIAFPLRMRKVDKHEAQARINDVLELVKLPGYGKRFTKQLSGGQQQRIALARALVFNPRVLLMDEPLGALDKKLREHMQLEIKRITQDLNITTIYVTHDQSEAMTMSDRIAIMNEGRIEQIGLPGEIYDFPTNYFVADFIGESNFIAGRVEKIGNQDCLFRTDGGLRCRTQSIPKKAIDEKGYLVIRPEKISLVKAGQSFANQFEANVEEALYLGDITTYVVKLVNDDSRLMVKQQNKFINYQIKKGEKTKIGWNESDNSIV